MFMSQNKIYLELACCILLTFLSHSYLKDLINYLVTVTQDENVSDFLYFYPKKLYTFGKIINIYNGTT